MIAKCVWDEKTKLGQYRKYQSWDGLGKYRLRRKRRVEEMGFQLVKEKRGWKIRHRRVEIGEGVTWWTTWRRWDERLFHKKGAEWQKDLFAILKREVREGRLRVIRYLDNWIFWLNKVSVTLFDARSLVTIWCHPLIQCETLCFEMTCDNSSKRIQGCRVDNIIW